MGINRELFSQKDISIQTKMMFANALVFSVLYYGNEIVSLDNTVEKIYQNTQNQILKRITY